MDIPLIFLLSSALTVLSGAAVGTPSDRIIIDVCSILNQDDLDIGMCCDKARGRHITSGEGPSITYLCCLGYFDDVKINHMNKIDFDLLVHIVKTEKENELLMEARFVVECGDDHAPPLTLRNYLNWKNSPQNPVCREKA